MNIGEKDIHTIETYGKTKELGRILGLDETIKILMYLMESPQKYTDITYQISLSDPSFTRRLKMLQSLNIITKQQIRSKKRITNAYVLTMQGEKLIEFIEAYEKEMKITVEQRKIIEIQN